MYVASSPPPPPCAILCLNNKIQIGDGGMQCFVFSPLGRTYWLFRRTLKKQTKEIWEGKIQKSRLRKRDLVSKKCALEKT